MVLLALGLSPAVFQVMGSRACCCAAIQSERPCCCHDQPDSSTCGLSCNPEQSQALLQSPLVVPQERLAAIALCCEMVVVFVRLPLESLDTRQQVPGGWVLPLSPPLLASLLNLPPPAALLS